MSDALKSKIADVFNEPGCEKNQSKGTKDKKRPLQQNLWASQCAWYRAISACS